MPVYKMTEIVGTSPESFEAAIREAIRRASASLRNLDWFEVKEQRGRIADGRVSEFQVKLSVGFRLEE